MTTTPILGITEVAANVNQKEVVINNGFVAVENATQAASSITITGTLRTLSAAEYTGAHDFIIANTVTAQATLQVPATQRSFQVDNSVNPTYGVVVKHAGTVGNTVTVPAAVLGEIATDGTNVRTPSSFGAVVAGVSSVNSRTGAVTLGATDLLAINAGKIIGNPGTAAAASSEITIGFDLALSTAGTLTHAPSISTITAAGSNQATGTTLTSTFNVVNAGSATPHVRLRSSPTTPQSVRNQMGASLTVWPASGAQINALGTNSAAVVPNNGEALFLPTSTIQWSA